VSGLSRRDVLAAFLGAPLALAACKKAKRIPDGELAFTPEALGHRLRDEAPPAIAADKWERAGIVIVGGGIAGLSAAWHLAEAGYEDFVLVELESAAGGTARSGANAVSAYPWGAHYITAPMKENERLLAALKAFGLVEGTDASGEPIFEEQYLCREPQERVFSAGEWHDGIYLHDGESDADKAQFARFRALLESWAEKRDAKGRRAFAVPTAFGSDDAEVAALDRMSMADWLTKEKLDAPRVRWLVDYACRDDFGSRPSQTSAWAGVHYWASRIAHRGREAQPVLTWPAGNGWLASKLFERVRKHVRFGLAVSDVIPDDDGIDVVAIGKAPVAAGWKAKRVIFAAPQFIAGRAIRPWRDSPPAHVASFAYVPWMVANITLSARPKHRPGTIMAWDNVLYDSPSLGYVVATHQTGRDHGPTVLTYYYPLAEDDLRAARKRLYAASREEWADVALADLEAAHPDIRELATRIDVVRWGHAMARPAPGLFFGGARAAARQPFRGIHFAHTDLSGIALFEEAFYHGARAADEALAGVRGPT